jgi:transposase-like protein
MATPSRYPAELHRRAVRLVFEERERSRGGRGAISSVADRVGVPRGTLGRWVRQAEAEHETAPARQARGAQRETGGQPDGNHGVPEASEIFRELRALRSSLESAERRRRRRMMVFLAVVLALIPLGILGAHLAIDYESGRVATAIERSSGPFTDEALARVCRSIKIPLFGPETKKRLHCPPSSVTNTTNEPPSTTEPATSTPAPTASR